MPLKFNFFLFFLFFFYFFFYFFTYGLTRYILIDILIGLLTGLLLFEDGGDNEVGDEGFIFSLINLFITGGSLSKSILETTFLSYPDFLVLHQWIHIFLFDF